MIRATRADGVTFLVAPHDFGEFMAATRGVVRVSTAAVGSAERELRAYSSADPSGAVGFLHHPGAPGPGEWWRCDTSAPDPSSPNS